MDLRIKINTMSTTDVIELVVRIFATGIAAACVVGIVWGAAEKIIEGIRLKKPKKK